MGFPYDGNAERLFRAMESSFEPWRPASSADRVLLLREIHYVPIWPSRSARHFAASEAVSNRVPSVARQRQASGAASIGWRTNSATTAAFFALRGLPLRVTLPCQTMTRSSPSTESLVASENQETLTADSAAWRTQPDGVRCCSTGPCRCSARFNTRSGASSSNNAVTER